MMRSDVVRKLRCEEELWAELGTPWNAYVTPPLPLPPNFQPCGNSACGRVVNFAWYRFARMNACSARCRTAVIALWRPIVMGGSCCDAPEDWRLIPGFAHHWISNRGRLRRPDDRITLGSWVNGYRQVGLRAAAPLARRQIVFVHRLVALAFLPPPEHSARWIVNHRDGDKGHGCVENLEWVTNGENVRHGRRRARGEAPNG
jgi:hypothetical protein